MPNEAPRSSSLERVIAFLIVGIVALSLIAFLAVIIGSAAGAGEHDGFSRGVWPAVLVLPLYGLPIAMLLLITLIVRSAIRRGRASKRAQ